MRPIVILESPYAGDVDLNVRYARAALRDSLLRGEAPYASHLLYTQHGVLRDDVSEERQMGISAGFAFHELASRTVVYGDFGVTAGMVAGIKNAESLGLPVEYRLIGRHWEAA